MGDDEGGIYLVASVNYHLEYTSLDPVAANITPFVNVLLF